MMVRPVVYFTDSTGFGGAEQSLLNLIKSLDRRRWTPVLIHHPDPGIEPLVCEARRWEVMTLAAPPMPEGRRGAVHIPAFVRQLRALRPAVFHAHLTWPLSCKYGLFAATLARIPAIVATLQLFVELPYSRSVRMKQRFFGAGIQRHVAVSQAVATRLAQVFGVPPCRIEVVPNGIPVNDFGSVVDDSLKTTLTGGTRRPIVLSIARLDQQKGQRYLLEAAARVPKAVFVLAGDGPDRQALEAQARELHLNDRVAFLGLRRDIPALLATCDMFVLPSLWEGLPLSVLEAMAARKPVIATEVGGTSEAVSHDETGLLIPPADPAALAASIQTLLCDPDRALRLAIAGRARVEREFSIETMTRRVTEIYDQLLDGA